MGVSKEDVVKGEKMDLDTILIEELGQFGKFQARAMVLIIVAVIFQGWSATEYIFTTGRINTRCLIPECETQPNVDFSPTWLEYAVPITSSGAADSCLRYNSSGISTGIVDYTCPANLFDTRATVGCDQYVYQDTHSIVYDYDMACDEWRRSLVGTARTFGTLLALPLTGYVSDRWGRRTALAINAFNTAWVGILRYFADTYVGFVVSQVVEAIIGSGIFSCCYILAMEIVGPKYRVAVGTMLNTTFAMGQVTMGLLAWAVPNWRHLTLTLYAPQLLTILFFWLVTESVRWCLSKGRYEESEKILKNIAKVNKTELSVKSFELLKNNAEQEKVLQRKEEEEKESEPWLIVQVFRHKGVLLRAAVSPVWWVTNTFIYYGLSINSVNMSGNRYVNYIAVSAVEIPGFWTAFVLMGIIGRKPVLSGAFWICGACQIAYIFMPDNLGTLSLVLYLIGKFAIAMVMTSIYVYTNELYPTKHRHSLFAFSSMVGRVGSMLAPLTPALGDAVWEQLPFALFGGMAILSGLLVQLTPETLGAPLPDTMEQADAIGRSRRKSDTTSL